MGTIDDLMSVRVVILPDVVAWLLTYAVHSSLLLGLAWLCTREEVIDYAERTRPPFNVNRLAHVAALAALVVLLGLLAAALLRNRPEEKGLRSIAASADDPAPRLQISSSLVWKRV